MGGHLFPCPDSLMTRVKYRVNFFLLSEVNYINLLENQFWWNFLEDAEKWTENRLKNFVFGTWLVGFGPGPRTAKHVSLDLARPKRKKVENSSRKIRPITPEIAFWSLRTFALKINLLEINVLFSFHNIPKISCYPYWVKNEFAFTLKFLANFGIKTLMIWPK